MSDVVLYDWPKTATKRGAVGKFTHLYDDKIYTLHPEDYGFKSVAELRKALWAAVANRGYKLESARDSTNPNVLYVKVDTQ